MLKHTPGPWTIDDLSLPSQKFVRIGDNVAHIPQRSKGKYYALNQLDKETQANARLIAKAPDLFSKLHEAISDWPEFDEDEPVEGSDLVEWFGYYRWQIKKLIGDLL